MQFVARSLSPCRSNRANEFRTRVSRLRLRASHRDFFNRGFAVFARAHCSSNEIAFARTDDLFCYLRVTSNQLRRLPDRRSKLRRHPLVQGVADAIMRLGNDRDHRCSLDGQSALARSGLLLGNRWNAAGDPYAKSAVWISGSALRQFLCCPFRNHHRHRFPDVNLRISSARDRRFAHVCLDGNLFRRCVRRGSAYRRELRFSSSQTGSRFASEFSVRFPAALSCPISRSGLSFLLRALRAICDCRSCAQTAKFSNGMKSFRVGKVTIGGKRPVFILGPCVIESEKFVWQMARSIAKICAAGDVDLIFKAFYDKANRTSRRLFRGISTCAGCEVLGSVGLVLKIAVTTDVHSSAEAEIAGEKIDMLQIPAFLCRQTDLLKAAGQTGRAVNVKKGQFLAPWDVRNIAEKLIAFGNEKFCFTERGTSFGYNNLVADMRSLYWLREAGYRVIFDATHSVQRPGGAGDSTSGDGVLAPALARGAMATGCDGIFMEVHEDPSRALSDAPNQIPLKDLPKHLRVLKAIHAAVSGRGD